jgi:sensor domain CHASE-containing protein
VIARLKLWAVVAGIFIVTLAASWFGGRKAGQTDAKLEEAEDAVQGHVLRNEVENRIARERDAADRLRKDWSED